MQEPAVVVNHVQPPHQGWKSWCSGCARSKEQVERLTGIYGDWTNQEKQGRKLEQSAVDEVIKLSKDHQIIEIAKITGISRTTIWRVLHGKWKVGGAHD